MSLPSLAKFHIKLASRVDSIQESPTLTVLNRAKELIAQGVDVVDFGPGEPDFGTPDNVSKAAIRAIESGYTKYTNALGCTELRQAVADTYNRRYSAGIGCRNVIAGTGGKQELFNLALALVSEGDEVIIPSPYWVSFPDQVTFAGGRPVFAETRASEGFRPSLAGIEAVASTRTRGVIINSPCNPTGAVINERELEAIIRFCHGRELFLVYDETYEFFVYEGKSHVSAMQWFSQYPETIIVVNSLSKTYAMTGWRLGYAVAHPDVIEAVGKIQSHSTSNPSSISQLAGVEALSSNSSGGQIRKMFEAYAERRIWLVPALNAIEGIECGSPDGAFYVFPNVRKVYGKQGISDSASLANYLLEDARVAVVPGSAFGADDYIRLSYATSLEKIREGVARIERSLAKLG